jgi:hypothetical protein
MKRIALSVLFAALASFAGAAPPTPDYAREQRIAEEIVPAVVVGDPVRLPGPDGRSFLGLLTVVPKAKAAVVLVHGYGVHPDWGLIGELRSSLADAGYTTLSIQMPVLAADAKADDYLALFPDAAQRITAAVEYLQGKEYRKIALVSHSLGSRMSNDYVLGTLPASLLAPSTNPLAAWVAIGMTSDYRGGARFRFPLLDLYGENDLPAVLKGAARRKDVVDKLDDSRTMMVPQADHFFNGRYKELDKAVREFLDQVLR